jgi:hypothetical protein
MRPLLVNFLVVLLPKGKILTRMRAWTNSQATL